jgi:MEMO1 family protein
MLVPHAAKRKALAVVVPHGEIRAAGSLFSAVYSAVEWPEVAILVGPDHGGAGESFGISVRGSWATPLGSLPIHERVARKLLQEIPRLARDEETHRYEHSLEVQLPFLQMTGTVAGFVPMTVRSVDPEAIEEVGTGLVRVLDRMKVPAVLVATAHLSGYVSPETEPAAGDLLREEMLGLRVQSFLERPEGRANRACGLGAVAVAMAAAGAVGIRRGESLGDLVRSTPGAGSVVRYAGMMFRRED